MCIVNLREYEKSVVERNVKGGKDGGHGRIF
jgi:hypothetical protein